jgi:aminocarboxymuconate-semialdehyde decarboxylase
MTDGRLIDCHCHVVPDRVLARFPGGSSPRFVTAESRVLGRMLETQEAVGITQALVSDSFFCETAAEELPDWSPTDRTKLYNDGLAALVQQYPGRLFGVGALQPWDGEAAARELERFPQLGLVGALVNPADGPRYLDDPSAEPVLAAAERLGLPLFIHPTRDLPANEHYVEFAVSLMVGRPAQTGVCAARLILSGTLDRHPDLKLLLAHGGGVLPFVVGRLDATWSAYRSAGRWDGPDVLSRPPSAYLRRFHVDSNTWATAPLRLILDTLGPDRLLFGTDQPPVWFPIEQSLMAVDCLELEPDVQQAVRWANAASLFNLPLDEL